MAARKSPVSDFDPSELMTQQKSHDEDIAKLKNLITKIDTPEHFAQTFESVFGDSKKLDAVVKGSIVSMLKDDAETKKAIVSLIQKTDAMFFRSGVWTMTKFIIAAIVGAAITVVAQALVR
jgi:hypothetical protein